MTTASLSALTWQVYAGNTTDLIAPVLVDLATFTGISVVPSGGGLGASANLSATGVVVDNMSGAGDCSVIIGPITTLVPRFQKANLPIPQSTTTVIFGSASPIKPIAYFYTGTFHGEGGSVNAFASQEAANVASITGGTTDAYLNSLTWNVNVKLANGYNLDNLTVSGFYDVLNPTSPSVGNLGAGTWQVDCRVYSSSALNIYQLARNLLSTDTQVWERRCVTGAWTAWRPIGQQVTGQCLFLSVDATHCKLIPWNGGLININGNLETVPYNAGNGLSFPNTIGAATLSPATLYYAYVYMSAPGVMAYEWSTTPYGLDFAGRPIKAGDPTRTNVGLVYTNSNGQFVDSPQFRQVETYFNRLVRDVNVTANSTASTTSTSLIQATNNSAFVCYGDAVLDIAFSGYMYNNTNGCYAQVYAWVDGNAFGNQCVGTSSTGNSLIPAGGRASSKIALGYHTLAVFCNVNGGTGFFPVGIWGIVR